MNTEHYKAASERTDADERALVPAFKRTASERAELYYTFDAENDTNTIASTAENDPAPNKAKAQEHFKDRESVVSGKFLLSKEKPWSQIRCEELQRDYASACIRAEDAKAHADKLAEALRDCETTPGALAERSHEYALRRLASITATAREAIKAYEAAQ